GQLDYFLLRPIESYLKPIAETWKSLLFLLPNDDLYNATFPIIRTPSKNYTVMDYEELFRDTNHENMIPAYHRVKNLTKAMAAPGVEVHCMFSYYGSHGNTDYYYEFLSNTSFPNGAMKIVYEDGDGTINLESARACLQWKFQQAQPVHEKAFYLVEHSALLYDKNLFKYMQELLFKQA
uniref:Uncharacterized protein n=1 Tax=Romanomermis culicivorax TaxID=13658 RepID=A0A915JM25_ROMCU